MYNCFILPTYFKITKANSNNYFHILILFLLNKNRKIFFFVNQFNFFETKLFELNYR